MPKKTPIRNIYIEDQHPVEIASKVISRPMTLNEWAKYGPASDKKRKNRMNLWSLQTNSKEEKKLKAKYPTENVIELIKKHGLEKAGRAEIAKELNISPFECGQLICQPRIQKAIKEIGIQKHGIKANVDPVVTEKKEAISDLITKVTVPAKPKSKIEQHIFLCADLHEIYVAKNTAYGDSFSVTFKEFGIMSALTRMSDKWNRIKSLAKGAENTIKDESIKDSLLDLANYAIMTVMELEGGENDESNRNSQNG